MRNPEVRRKLLHQQFDKPCSQWSMKGASSYSSECRSRHDDGQQAAGNSHPTVLTTWNMCSLRCVDCFFPYFEAVKHTLHPNGKTPGGWLDDSPSYSSLTSANTVWGLCQQLPGSKVHREQLARTAKLLSSWSALVCHMRAHIISSCKAYSSESAS